MPRVYLNQDGLYGDITDYISTIGWSGGIGSVARKLDISLVNSLLDKNIPTLHIKNGSMLKLFQDDGGELFKGFVFVNSRASQSSTIDVVAYDHLIYTQKNKCVYNIKNKTAEEITSMICTDFQIPKGSFAKTGIKQSFIANKKTLYDTIIKGYTGASKQNGKKYMARIKQGKMDIIEMGSVVTSFMLSDETNIIDSGYSESIENMVNRVRIYDSKGNPIGMVENTEWIKAYGVLQDIYTKENDKQANTVAKGMLEGIEKRANVTAIGNVECISGNGIQLKDNASGLTGVFFIESDSHTWKNGQHIMRLNLNFKNVMDERS